MVNSKQLHKVIIFILMTIAACQQKPMKVESYAIKINDSTSYVDFCKTYSAFEWDSILLVQPYTNFKVLQYGLGLDNISCIKSEIEEISSIDWKYFLLFVKGKSQVIAYSEIPIKYVNFQFNTKKKFYYVTKNNCLLQYNSEMKSLLVN